MLTFDIDTSLFRCSTILDSYGWAALRKVVLLSTVYFVTRLWPVPTYAEMLNIHSK